MSAAATPPTRPAPSTVPIAVLVSGRGSNLEALIAARDASQLPVSFSLVASDHAEAPALRRAEQHGIPTLALDRHAYANRRDFDLDLLARVADSGAQLMVLAGFMRVLDADAVRPWHGRMLNIHPSLLPKYRGLHTHRKALEACDREHGASVHFVTPELDGGPVIAQAVIPILPGDTEDSLADRLLIHEHLLLPATLALVATGRVVLTPGGVEFDGKPLTAPLRLQDDQLVVAPPRTATAPTTHAINRDSH